jgi:hypothetical protein
MWINDDTLNAIERELSGNQRERSDVRTGAGQPTVGKGRVAFGENVSVINADSTSLSVGTNDAVYCSRVVPCASASAVDDDDDDVRCTTSFPLLAVVVKQQLSFDICTTYIQRRR